jgi:hypothetical protein
MAKDKGIVIQFTEDLKGTPENVLTLSVDAQLHKKFIKTQPSIIQYGDIKWVTDGLADSTNYVGASSSYYPFSLRYWFDKPAGIKRLRIFKWSYIPNAFKVEGSNDEGVTWTQIYAGNAANATGWEEFTVSDGTAKYKEIRLNFTSGYSSRVYIYEVEMFGDIEEYVSNNEDAFSVTSKRYKHTATTELVDNTHKVKYIQRYLDTKNALLLVLDPNTRMRDVAGEVTIKYNAAFGALAGRGGPVQTFEINFTPADLIPAPDPGIGDVVGVSMSGITATYRQVDFTNVYNDKNTDVVGVSMNNIIVKFTPVNGSGV